MKVILYGGSSAAVAKILTILLSFISLPLTIHYLGPDRYGVWVTIITTTAWIAVLEFGLTDTLTNTIATSHATGDREVAARHTANALAITFIFACLLFAIGAFIWPYLDWMRIFNVRAGVNASEIRNTITVACLLILLAPICTIGAKILSGYQQTHTANLVTAVAAMLSVGGLLLGLYLRLSMPMLFLCTTGFVTLSGVITLIWVLFIAKPWLRPRMDYLSVSLSKQLLATGAPFFLIRIAGIVVFSTDNLIISHFLGADHVTPYSVGMRLVTCAQLIPSFLFPSLWASYAESAALGDIAWIHRTYTRTMRYTMVIVSAILVVIALFGRWIIAVWAGQVAVPSEPLLLGMCIWTIIWGITNVQSCLLGALGRTRIQAVSGMIAAVFNLVLSIMLVQRIGAIGVIASTVISYICIIVLQTREVSAYFRQQRAPAYG